ncbi:MAG: energy transducer TonB [Bryobacteraceae bacterium]
MHVAALAGVFCIVLPLHAQVAVGRITSHPPLSPVDLASLEANLQANPEDIAARLRLLVHYRDFAPVPPYDNAARRAARLSHVVYLVEHNPSAADLELTYVFRAGGPYADPNDHELVRGYWLRAVEAKPGDLPVLLHAVRFLFVENKDQAEELLKRALAVAPNERAIAANLGFLYALEILGLDSFRGIAAPSESPAARAALAQRARGALEVASNAAVLAAAATAIPNLAMRATMGRPVDPELFQLSSRLMTRAREMEPADDAFRGPMPLIEYFQEATNGRQEASPPEAVAAPSDPSRVRIGAEVLKAKLIRQTQPVYPELARQARLQGNVRLEAVIGRDGSIASLTPLSGHPLLLPAALEAVKQWSYQPTFLNGNPVEVVTEIVVPFSLVR